MFRAILMRHFDEIFWWDIPKRHSDETLGWNILMTHIDKTHWWETWMAFEKLWWHLMTLDDLWYGNDVNGMPYDSFDCFLFYKGPIQIALLWSLGTV